MNPIDKKKFSEQDICDKYITPAILESGWDLHSQFRAQMTFTAGKIIINGKTAKRGKQKRADYILYYKPNIPIAIIEAKDNKHSVGSGMQQALGYAEILDLPFVYSSNGDAFLEHDRTENTKQPEKEIPLEQFPSPQDLWKRYCEWKGLTPPQESIVSQDYYIDTSRNKPPRYYQVNAINRTIEAIAKGQKRILLVMATGTGKTYTAFQIIWRLWKSKTWKEGKKGRILFLADRNILVDQTKNNDFKPFGQVMTKIQKRQANKSYEIYLSLYQAVTGSEEESNIYKQFSPDFFDLIIVDECHRGSAKEDSAWREILEYFTSSSQIGLTATPKETKSVSNIEYFGEPIYTYSLKQGIEDGFLAPYRVIRVDLDKDLTGWRPEKGKKDKYGEEIEDRIYNQKDFDRSLVLEKRTEIVANKITEFLNATDQYAKTIVFCENIDHAERMRQALVNTNSELAAENRKFVMRITGDNDEGKAELDNFIDPENKFPVIATTSKLMNTGVDSQTCRLIVLDQNIKSMTQFKQIIGRGTRVNEEYEKYFFTIMDFRKATELFADPNFDGEPVQIYQAKEDEPLIPPDLEMEETNETEEIAPDSEEAKEHDPLEDITWDPSEEGKTKRKYIVDGVPVYVVAERVQYMGRDGKLITESLKDYTKKKVQEDYRSLESFLQSWSKSEQKNAIIQELEESGILLEALAEEVGKDFDPFDLVCHVAFDQPPLTRQERANNVRKRNYFSKYQEKAREVLNALLDKYSDEGIENIEEMEILKLQPLNQIGTPIEIVKYFGGKQEYLKALKELEDELYKTA